MRGLSSTSSLSSCGLCPSGRWCWPCPPALVPSRLGSGSASWRGAPCGWRPWTSGRSNKQVWDDRMREMWSDGFYSSSYLFYIYVLFGTGLEHPNTNRFPKTLGILGIHPFPGGVVVFVPHWERTETLIWSSALSHRRPLLEAFFTLSLPLILVCKSLLSVKRTTSCGTTGPVSGHSVADAAGQK